MFILCFLKVMYSNNPMVICAPTGSGKTVLFELSIIRLLLSTPNFNYKIVYCKYVLLSQFAILTFS